MTAFGPPLPFVLSVKLPLLKAPLRAVKAPLAFLGLLFNTVVMLTAGFTTVKSSALLLFAVGGRSDGLTLLPNFF